MDCRERREKGKKEMKGKELTEKKTENESSKRINEMEMNCYVNFGKVGKRRKWKPRMEKKDGQKKEEH